ncbi:calmodulin-binding transcription activator 2 isoform X10 [Canis lupus baileyi]|uniref:calmodulin-binding transcription activator 2 isoform X10 n=1 Tax=Canis lupus familiaris TaxID=9615 RepID=UPI0006B3EAA6|nr:calmodulin-binding transcription activator 2 isoform X10 [Canis lupus familiaris]XP_038392457.1 calmodulin-binding transcription activator 2 isoform X10 [Canis lupus familiaris]XP_038521178.1 calmodulin-binding transcription activator 2 isoform X10 [Canis lupus familiaris]
MGTDSPSPRPLRPGVTLPPGALTMNTKDTTEVAENSHHLKIFLPKKLLECLPRCPLLPPERLRWNTNEEIASYLITFEKHDEWLSCAPKTRPQNGSIILYNRKKVKYRKDGYLWKKRKDGKTTREDHMKLKVQGMENPDIVLVHYLNVPALEDCGKGCSPIFCPVSSDRREWLKWSREELLGQLRPMFHGIKWSCGNGTEEFSVEQLVQQILDTHPTKPAPRTHACLCSGGLGSGSLTHKCSSTKHRIISPKVEPRALTLTSVPHPHPPEPPPLIAPLPPELPKAHASPSSSSSSSSSSSGFAEPLEIRPSPPTSRGGSSRGGTAILLLTGLEQRAGGLTPTRHLAPQTDPRPSMSLAVVVGSETSSPPAPPSPAFDPDRFLNSPQRGQTYGGGQGVSPDFPEAEATHTPCPALEPAAALEPQAAARGPPPLPGASGRRGNRFFIQDDGSGEELKAQGAAPPAPSPHPSPPPSPAPLEPPGRGGRGETLFGGAAGASELEPFGLASFPDLMGELISDEAPGAPVPTAQLSPALSTITDFSPEWSYPEGGVKVLITGPWTEAAEHYSCVFDHIAVPASLVQPGVLRCYCPAHEVGLVSLQVAGREGPLSASVLFEYRARRFLSLPSTQLDWLSLDDNQFRMSILERLEQMEKRMADMAAAGQAPCRSPNAPPIQDEGQGPGFEARVVVLVENMIPRSTWRGPERLAHGSPFRGMSLLHLAAAQGYARLIDTLSQWRSMGTVSLDLEQEADPLNVDHFSCTPLMWACALGHLEAAVLLFRWNRQALSIPDSLGRLPLSVAQSRGHVRLARCLEELQRQEAAAELPLALSPPSSSPDTGLSSVSSPSELSDGTFSVTSAYSSAPDGSPPPAPVLASEMAMEETMPGQLSSGAPEGPLFLMDCEATNPQEPVPSRPPFPPAPEGGAASEEADSPPAVDVIPVDMISLARQIIEATPERIKREDFVGLPDAGAPMRERTGALGLSETMSWLASYLENVDHFPSSAPPSELPLERGRLSVPPAPSWAEFLSASASGKMESDFALLTLSDHEQRELYEAARVIQTAFRKYKGRRLKEQQEVAAAVIQRCYRKYKQLTWIALKFALYKKMTQAAILIQSKFRSYYEQKRFQQSRRAAVLIQQHYRSYRRRPAGTLQARSNRGSFLTKKQDQAARKIMRFLRRCRHRMRELKQNQELEGLPQPGLAT